MWKYVEQRSMVARRSLNGELYKKIYVLQFLLRFAEVLNFASASH